MERPQTIGVLGTGTMGAGIAQLAAMSGARTLLHDTSPAAITRAKERISRGLAQASRRGRITGPEATAALQRIEPAPDRGTLAACELVIEAASEQFELKRELFAALEQITAPDCVLATNTSSFLVGAIAAAVDRPERVVGMHFFNPPVSMRLMELIAAPASSRAALARARAAAEAMGKTVVEVGDGPGFLVNRCNRPYSLEPQRLLAERMAGVEAIDRICRLGGRFPMGPFELMDLVGLDVSLAAARSFHEQSFGEPRWQPSPVAARQVASGFLGRKSGRGFYIYPEGGAPHREADPEPPEAEPGDGVVVVAGESTLAEALQCAGEEAGWEMLTPEEAVQAEPPVLVLDLTGGEERLPLQGGPRAVCCAAGSLAALEQGGAAVGFNAVPPFETTRLVELTRSADTAGAAADAAVRFFTSLGCHTEWVGDAPGLVLGRIVCQLVNEAAFALGAGVGTPDAIDAGLRVGLNYPHGPLEWGDMIGLDQVLTTLEALYDERREQRYRPAPELTRRVWTGRLGVQTGEGFHRYE